MICWQKGIKFLIHTLGGVLVVGEWMGGCLEESVTWLHDLNMPISYILG